MWVPTRWATAQMVSPGCASTCWPSSSKMTPGRASGLALSRAAGVTAVLAAGGAGRSIRLLLMIGLFRCGQLRRWKQFREKTNNAGQGIGRGLTQSTDRGIAHAVGQFPQETRVPDA